MDAEKRSGDVTNYDTLSADDRVLLWRVYTCVRDLNAALDDANKAHFEIYVSTPISSVGEQKTVKVNISRRYSYPDEEMEECK